MLKSFVKVFGGDPNKRDIRRFSETVEYINSLEPGFRSLSDAELRAKTDEFRARLADGETPDDLQPEAFAAVREAAMRTLGQRHYDVQLIGGIVIHQGKIAEMRTGEGKTLVATLPIYLNALEGRGVHLITVNDYLARRDARWMGALFNFLGLSVGVLQEAARTEHGKKAFLVDFEHESPQEDQNHLRLVDRRLAYAADITYGTNNEFGFDYLRDNMAMRLADRVQRERRYAIVDEIDNILIDEARTPLIISGPSHEDPGNYVRMAQVVKQLDRSDFEINERDRTISLTEQGEEHVAELLGQPLYDPDRPEDITPEQAQTLGFLEQALRAEYLFKRNKDYLVQGGKVVIVDEFTGRLMHGRRWSDGLHQAVEAKEGVKVQEENVTYATITLQNYFRLYGKLAGMTGTALTEAEEFSKIYKLDVVPIPPNLEYVAARPESGLTDVEFKENGSKFHYYARHEDPALPVFWKRKDYADQVYRTEEAKLRAICTEILRRYALGQPLLVGTTSVENSDLISRRLKPDPLRRLVQTLLLRDAWFEFHQQEEDGRMVEELLPLNERLEDLNSSDMRNLAKELNLSFNPEEPENLDRLARILYLPTEDETRVDMEATLPSPDRSARSGEGLGARPRLLEALRGGVRHQVLNARKHDEESQIIAGAGALGAVTIATNMAGRGVDIKLGGELAEEVMTEVNRVLRRAGVADPYNMTMAERLDALDQVTDEQIGIYGAEIAFFRQHMADEARVRQAGGLHVVGTERHEARRIDNQLRGRAARQGDPGSSQFYLSLGDELMRRFGGSQVSDLMQRLKIDDAVPVAHGIVNKTIEQSQTRVEGANFDVRKHLLEYDDVLNTQRNKIYEQRDRIFTKEALDEDIETMLAAEVERHVRSTVAGEGWKLLAWLEEIQPSLPIGEDRLYPSYMLRLLRDDLAAAKTREAALAGLLQIAREALEAEREHLMHLVEEQIDRSAERSKQIIRERREMVELAIEGVDASAEARESDQTVDPQKMAEAVSQATGMELSLDRKTLREAAGDLRSFKATLLELAETNAVHNVWDALIAGVVRRLGVPLNVPRPEGPRVDWQAGGDRLLQAVESAHAERTRQVEVEIERQVGELLGRAVEITPDLLTRLLIEMAFGTLVLFDRQTHQRRALRTRRLTYIYSVARKLDGRPQAQALTEEILDHLKGAQKALAQIWGEAELARHAKAGLRMADLPQRALDRLKAAPGDRRQWDDTASSPLGALHGELRERVIEELGRESLNEIYRQLMLSVSGQLWVEYLTQVEALRTSIGLEAYGQRDPLVQYKSKAFDLFQELLVNMRGGVVSRLFAFRPQAPAMLDRSAPRAGVPATTAPRGVAGASRPGASRPAAGNGDTRGGAGPPPNLGRNDECWCSSGKKYKHCHYDSDRAQQPAPVAAGNLPTSEVVEGARKRRRRKKR